MRWAPATARRAGLGPVGNRACCTRWWPLGGQPATHQLEPRARRCRCWDCSTSNSTCARRGRWPRKRTRTVAVGPGRGGRASPSCGPAACAQSVLRQPRGAGSWWLTAARLFTSICVSAGSRGWALWYGPPRTEAWLPYLQRRRRSLPWPGRS